MKMRIRSKWRNKDRPTSVEDNATALAYVIWQIGLAAAKNLHAEDFDYASDEQRIAVITEYLVFLTHVSDRLAYDSMEQDSRQTFMVTLAKAVAHQLHRNQTEILGSGEYGKQFIDLLNQRSEEYADTSFSPAGPGYEALRCFVNKVQDVMGHDQTNRWVSDHIMDIDAPEAIKNLKQALANLLGTSSDIDLRRLANPD